VVPVLVMLNLLSGSATPPESMPDWLIKVMQFTPTPHFVTTRIFDRPSGGAEHCQAGNLTLFHAAVFRLAP
jgi:hypothetical protein